MASFEAFQVVVLRLEYTRLLKLEQILKNYASYAKSLILSHSKNNKFTRKHVPCFKEMHDK